MRSGEVISASTSEIGQTWALKAMAKVALGTEIQVG